MSIHHSSSLISPPFHPARINAPTTNCSSVNQSDDHDDRMMKISLLHQAEGLLLLHSPYGTKCFELRNKQDLARPRDLMLGTTE